jgi:hypothetical protein
MQKNKQAMPAIKRNNLKETFKTVNKPTEQKCYNNRMGQSIFKMSSPVHTGLLCIATTVAR